MIQTQKILKEKIGLSRTGETFLTIHGNFK